MNNIPILSGEIERISNGRNTLPETTPITTQYPQYQPKQAFGSSPPTMQSYGPSADQQQQPQQQQYLQVGATSPEVTFSDEQYDSDLEDDGELGPSRETLQEGQILKSGYLHKKGERIKIWKKKWFVLRTSKLAYYKDSKEYELLRIIDIRDIHKAAEVVVKHKTGVFVILTPRRTFTVQADSTTEMEEWVYAINQARAQYELASSSDIGSSLSVHLEHPSSGPVKKNEMAKQGSGIPPSRRQHNPLSLSDPGLLANGENAGRNLSSQTLPPMSRALDPNVSELSMGQTPSPNMANNRANNGASANLNKHPESDRTKDRLSLVTVGTQAIRIGSSPTSPPRQDGGSGDFPQNSFSSNHSFNISPGAPNSPEYGSGGDQFGMGEPNVSSEEEDVVDDPTVLEAGRIAAAANAPGSGLVTGEQLESKVVRQGYMLKFGKKYKTWRKKWFVLRGDKLTYYKNAKEYQPLGIIALSTIIDSLQTDPVSKSKQYCLRIVTSKRSFVCCAPDEDTLLQWIDALHVECARVAREAKREKEFEMEHHDEEDDSILADPKALGRTAHIEANANISLSRQGYAHGGSSGVLGPKALYQDANGHGSTAGPSVSFAASTLPSTSAPVSHSTKLQPPPSILRSIQDGSGATPRSNPATVTFSV
ncbi:hypothetical protein BGZ79_009519 [Entomortierella chlamydospora]|nr:hypothetical protein BGZ79_009519 [Entomortierella chlamydospora]